MAFSGLTAPLLERKGVFHRTAEPITAGLAQSFVPDLFCCGFPVSNTKGTGAAWSGAQVELWGSGGDGGAVCRHRLLTKTRGTPRPGSTRSSRGQRETSWCLCNPAFLLRGSQVFQMEWRYLTYAYTFLKAREAEISEPSKSLEKRVVVQAQAPSLANPSKPRYQGIFRHREETRGIDPLQVPTRSTSVGTRPRGGR